MVQVSEHWFERHQDQLRGLYRFPPVKKISDYLQVDLDTAKQIRGIIKGDVDPTKVPKVQQWLEECYNLPNRIELMMAAIDGLMDAFGVEAISNQEGLNDPRLDPLALYVNTGDTYNATVLFDYEKRAFQLMTWGDFVERRNDID